MNRREALFAMAGALGLTASTQVFGAAAFLKGTRGAGTLSQSARAGLLPVINAAADAIIPQTDSPSASAAGVGEFILESVADLYSDEELAAFVTLPELLDSASEGHFVDLSPEQREAVLLKLEKRGDAAPYQMLKQLTVWGYFTSEAGSKQARAHLPIPGRYEGCVPLKEGQKAWAL